MRNRILLAEDDPVSARFLTDALGDCADVVVVGNAAAALHVAQQQEFDLWLLDRQLPDGRAEQLLPQLRQAARNGRVPAIALSAEVDRALSELLLSCGFAAVLAKPLSVAELLAAVQAQMPALAIAEPPWDDERAQRSLGPRPDAIRHLRQLMLRDLPQQRSAIESALHAADWVTLRAELHRLKAACGFCGAARLAAVVEQLSATPEIAQWPLFDAACQQLLDVGST